MAESKTKSAAPKTAVAKKPAAAKKPATAKKTVAAKKPAAVKPAAKSTAKPVAKVVAKPVASKKAAGWTPGPQERYNMVQVAAYYIAERNGFNGNPMSFWEEAEKQVASMLAGK
jgi:cell division septation protein DedD